MGRTRTMTWVRVSPPSIRVGLAEGWVVIKPCESLYMMRCNACKGELSAYNLAEDDILFRIHLNITQTRSWRVSSEGELRMSEIKLYTMKNDLLTRYVLRQALYQPESFQNNVQHTSRCGWYTVAWSHPPVVDAECMKRIIRVVRIRSGVRERERVSVFSSVFVVEVERTLLFRQRVGSKQPD